MKKLISIILLIGLLLSMLGCTKQPDDPDTPVDPDNNEGWVYDGPGYAALYADLGKAEVDLSQADGVLKKILDSGVMVMATSPDYPPAEYPDAETGEIKGSDILLAKYIANSLGVELQIETMEFGAVLVSLDTGKSDVAISGFGYKADRAENYELSHGYQSDDDTGHHTLLVRAKDADQYNSLSDFDGKVIYAQANSLQQMYVEDQILPICPNAKLELFNDINEALLGMAANKADAVAFDSTTALNYANTSDGLFVSLYKEKKIEFDLSRYEDYAGNVICVKKGETSLINAINQIIDQMMAEGKYKDMYYAACDDCGVDPTAEDE